VGKPPCRCRPRLAIVWDDRVFTVTALPEKRQRLLLCFARSTGEILWQQTVVEGPLESSIPRTVTPPAHQPRRQAVYVVFRVGDEIVVAAHDFADGRQLWLVRPGTHTGDGASANEPGALS